MVGGVAHAGAVHTEVLLLHSKLPTAGTIWLRCWVCRCRAVRQLFSIFAGSFVGELALQLPALPLAGYAMLRLSSLWCQHDAVC